MLWKWVLKGRGMEVDEENVQKLKRVKKKAVWYFHKKEKNLIKLVTWALTLDFLLGFGDFILTLEP